MPCTRPHRLAAAAARAAPRGQAAVQHQVCRLQIGGLRELLDGEAPAACTARVTRRVMCVCACVCVHVSVCVRPKRQWQGDGC
jgi:hypothetical protein